MNANNQKKFYIGAGAVVVLVAVFMLGNAFGRHAVRDSFLSNPAVDTSLVSQDMFSPFWQVWRILDDKYVAAASTTPQDKVWGAIKGLAASEGDPYTVFFPPTEDKLFQSDIQGDFEGVGMEIDVKDGVLTVIAPLKGSPAEKAGVMSGDEVIKIDGKDTSDMTVDTAVQLIRGPKGSIVTLTLLRSGVTVPIVKKVTRDVINVPTVDTNTIGTGSESVFVIHIYSFSAQSADLFRGALRDFVQSGSHKLVIDLRGNPGGYLDAAWDMASWFLPAGKTVVTEDFGGKSPSQVYLSKGYDIFNKNLQMLLLVDGGSASASEILAGALRENGVAKLVGTKTFGKGSVQELVPITADTSLKVTVARWLTPDGHNLSHDGLDPDYNVPITADEVASGTDPQLNKALELLKSQP